MNGSNNENEWNTLSLDQDETGHIKKIDKNISRHLTLAEKAAVITLNGLMSLKRYPRIDEPEGCVSLLMAKSAKNVRFAVKGLKLGYYSGASAVLRSAFEDLAFAVLFTLEPSQVAKWFRNQFSKLPFDQLGSFREQQKKHARKALLSQENSLIMIKDALSEYVSKANIHIHPSILGLSEEFRIDLEYFINEEMGEALSESEGNLTEALNRYIIKTSFRDYVPREQPSESKDASELVFIELTGRYDEEKIGDLALFAFYIAHRLLDLTKIVFEVESKEFFQHYKDWHKAIKDLGWSTGHKPTGHKPVTSLLVTSSSQVFYCTLGRYV